MELPSLHNFEKKKIIDLVGGWATPLKNISQLGWLFPIYGKIKPTWWTTHQLLRKQPSHPNPSIPSSSVFGGLRGVPSCAGETSAVWGAKASTFSKGIHDQIWSAHATTTGFPKCAYKAQTLHKVFWLNGFWSLDEDLWGKVSSMGSWYSPEGHQVSWQTGGCKMDGRHGWLCLKMVVLPLKICTST